MLIFSNTFLLIIISTLVNNCILRDAKKFLLKESELFTVRR